MQLKPVGLPMLIKAGSCCLSHRIPEGKTPAQLGTGMEAMGVGAKGYLAYFAFSFQGKSAGEFVLPRIWDNAVRQANHTPATRPGRLAAGSLQKVSGSPFMYFDGF